MEPLDPRRDDAPRTTAYTPKRSPWPGLVGAAAVLAAVVAAVMFAKPNDSGAPLDKGASVTVPTSAPQANDNSNATQPRDDSKVATRPAPAQQ